MNENKYNFIPLEKPVPITEQTWPNNTLPLVATSTNTFNHKPYIRDCIEGILMQETTFPVRVVIFDDCSTDGTREIIQEYEARYPQLIKGIYPKKNTWGKTERKEALQPRNKARNDAKYIAFCEGDDYWIDPLKLQKQVDFLEKNQNYVLTSHLRIIVDQNGNQLTNTDSLEKDYGTQCLVYRNVLADDYLSFDSKGITNGDTFLLTYLESFGKMTILDFAGSAYRKTGTGIWAKYDYRKKFELAKQSTFRMKYFFKKYNYKKSLQITKTHEINCIYKYAKDLKSNNYIKEAYKYYFQFISKLLRNLNNPYIYRLTYLKMILAFPIKK